jgi:hypothetical protein
MPWRPVRVSHVRRSSAAPSSRDETVTYRDREVVLGAALVAAIVASRTYASVHLDLGEQLRKGNGLDEVGLES